MVLTSIKSIKSVGCVSPVLTGPVCRPAAECPGTDEVLLLSRSQTLHTPTSPGLPSSLLTWSRHYQQISQWPPLELMVLWGPRGRLTPEFWQTADRDVKVRLLQSCRAVLPIITGQKSESCTKRFLKRSKGPTRSDWFASEQYVTVSGRHDVTKCSLSMFTSL